jgi:hypothetical protein
LSKACFTLHYALLACFARAYDTHHLTTLLATTSLIACCSGPGPFTLFAPTNEAFASVANWNYIHSIPEILEGFLKLHIVVDAIMLSQDFQLGQLTKMREGHKLNVTSLDPLKVNQATVTQANIVASNGVSYHVPHQSQLNTQSSGLPPRMPSLLENPLTFFTNTCHPSQRYHLSFSTKKDCIFHATQ